MPTLDWIGKIVVVNHHRGVPYRLVHCDGDLSSGDLSVGREFSRFQADWQRHFGSRRITLARRVAACGTLAGKR